jgi:hypothetical protein
MREGFLFKIVLDRYRMQSQAVASAGRMSAPWGSGALARITLVQRVLPRTLLVPWPATHSLRPRPTPPCAGQRADHFRTPRCPRCHAAHARFVAEPNLGHTEL